ncbi:unnamed protein product [Amoebophrya sp. A120]|nr:unnamed protein product [Amoebophrya sp. A120]|eukprot:GSA120T00015555001.1
MSFLPGAGGVFRTWSSQLPKMILRAKKCKRGLQMAQMLSAMVLTVTILYRASSVSALTRTRSSRGDACNIFGNMGGGGEGGEAIVLQPGEDDCWNHCDHENGPCAACGTGGMCCRIGFEGNGCNGSIGGSGFHTCVIPWTAGQLVRVRDVPSAPANLVGRYGTVVDEDDISFADSADFKIIQLQEDSNVGEDERKGMENERARSLAPASSGDMISGTAELQVQDQNSFTGGPEQYHQPHVTLHVDALAPLVKTSNKERVPIPQQIAISVDKVLFYNSPSGSAGTPTLGVGRPGSSSSLSSKVNFLSSNTLQKSGKVTYVTELPASSNKKFEKQKGREEVAGHARRDEVVVDDPFSDPQVVTFKGIAYGQAEVWEAPKPPRADQLGQPVVVAQPAAFVVPGADAPPAGAASTGAASAGAATSTVVSTQRQVASPPSNSLPKNTRRRVPMKKNANSGQLQGEDKDDATSMRLSAFRPEDQHALSSGAPAAQGSSFVAVVQPPPPSPSNFRFFAIESRSGCQNGELHRNPDQASSRNCLRLDITMPVRRALELQAKQQGQGTKIGTAVQSSTASAAGTSSTTATQTSSPHQKLLQPPVKGAPAAGGTATSTTSTSTSAQHTKKMPVFVYFAGSCFADGSQTDGKQFLKNLLQYSREEFLFVSLQIRAGTLGHAASTGLVYSGTTTGAVAAGDPYHQKEKDADYANWSLLDSRLALQWIQRHIHHFGGDKTRVTLFGQSSGACMASAHFVSPKSFDLFSNVIASSGGFNGWCTAGLDVAEDQFESLYVQATKYLKQEPECLQLGGTSSSGVLPAGAGAGHLGTAAGGGPATAWPQSRAAGSLPLFRDPSLQHLQQEFSGSLSPGGGITTKPPTAANSPKVPALKRSKLGNSRQDLQLAKESESSDKDRKGGPPSRAAGTNNSSSSFHDIRKNSEKQTCMAAWLKQQVHTHKTLSEYDLAGFPVPSPCFSGCDSSLIVDKKQILASMPEILKYGTAGVHFAQKPVLHGYTRDDGLDFMGEAKVEVPVTVAPPLTGGGSDAGAAHSEYGQQQQLLQHEADRILNMDIDGEEHQGHDGTASGMQRSTSTSSASSSVAEGGTLSGGSGGDETSNGTGSGTGTATTSRASSSSGDVQMIAPDEEHVEQGTTATVGRDGVVSSNMQPNYGFKNKSGTKTKRKTLSWRRLLTSREAFLKYLKWAFYVPGGVVEADQVLEKRKTSPARTEVARNQGNFQSLEPWSTSASSPPAKGGFTKRTHEERPELDAREDQDSWFFDFSQQLADAYAPAESDTLRDAEQDRAAAAASNKGGMLVQPFSILYNNLNASGPNGGAGCCAVNLLNDLREFGRGAYQAVWSRIRDSWAGQASGRLLRRGSSSFQLLEAGGGEDGVAASAGRRGAPAGEASDHLDLVQQTGAAAAGGELHQDQDVVMDDREPEQGDDLHDQDVIEQAGSPSTSYFNYLSHPKSQSKPTLPITDEKSPFKKHKSWFFATERAFTSWEYTCPTEFASDVLAEKGIPVYEYGYVDDNDDENYLPLVPHGWESWPLFAKHTEVKRTSSSTFCAGDHDRVLRIGSKTSVSVSMKKKNEMATLASQMARYWANFAIFGNPNGLGRTSAAAGTAAGGPLDESRHEGPMQRPIPQAAAQLGRVGGGTAATTSSTTVNHNDGLFTDFGFLMKKKELESALLQEYRRLKETLAMSEQSSTSTEPSQSSFTVGAVSPSGMSRSAGVEEAASVEKSVQGRLQKTRVVSSVSKVVEQQKVKNRLMVMKRFLAPEDVARLEQEGEISCSPTLQLTGGKMLTGTETSSPFHGYQVQFQSSPAGTTTISPRASNKGKKLAAPSELAQQGRCAQNSSGAPPPTSLPTGKIKKAGLLMSPGADYTTTNTRASNASTAVPDEDSCAEGSSRSSIGSFGFAALRLEDDSTTRFSSVDESSTRKKTRTSGLVLTSTAKDGQTGKHEEPLILHPELLPPLPHWPRFESKEDPFGFSLARGEQYMGLNQRLDTQAQCGLWKENWAELFVCLKTNDRLWSMGEN